MLQQYEFHNKQKTSTENALKLLLVVILILLEHCY